MWLVTGGSGQLGLALSEQLLLEGESFISLGSKELDITNVDQVNDVILGIKPQVIVNTAAWTNVDGAEQNKMLVHAINETGAKNLALAARLVSSIFVQISTDYVFSGKSEQPINELSQLSPQNVYGFSKAAGELAIKNLYSERSYIIRTAWLYSEYGKNFAKTICNLALASDKVVKVVNDQIGQPSNANDLARQIIKLVNTNAKFGIYHGTNQGQASWFDFAQEVFYLIGADKRRVVPVASSEFPSLAKRPERSILSHSAWREAGISPMQDWRIALEKSMPAIIDSVKAGT